jgi:hypothetical protein
MCMSVGRDVACCTTSIYIVRQMIDHKNINIAKEFDGHVFRV